MAKRVRVYDFRSPDKFSKEDLRALELVANHYSRLAVPILAGQLRSNAAFEVRELGQSTFGYLLDSLPPHTITVTCSLRPLTGRLLATLDPTLALVMLDLLMGGRGVPMTPRPLTDIELSLLRRFFEHLLGEFGSAISEQGEFRLVPEGIESNPLFAQIMAPTDTVAWMRFQLKVEGVNGDLNILLPHALVEPLLPHLVDRTRAAEAGAGERWHLGGVPVTLAAVLGTVRLSLQEFLALEVGDVVTLGTRVGRPLELWVENQRTFLGRVGTIGREVVFEVTDRIVKGDAVDE
jgi:flagellar motor switch protein FliM